MIYEEFLNFLDSGFLIDGKFIKIFVENYIKNNNLENHYDGVLIDFLSPYMGVYLLDQKKIIINLDLFVKKALNIKGEYIMGKKYSNATSEYDNVIEPSKKKGGLLSSLKSKLSDSLNTISGGLFGKLNELKNKF